MLLKYTFHTENSNNIFSNNLIKYISNTGEKCGASKESDTNPFIR
jgi:hypothetical protein